MKRTPGKEYISLHISEQGTKASGDKRRGDGEPHEEHIKMGISEQTAQLGRKKLGWE